MKWYSLVGGGIEGTPYNGLYGEFPPKGVYKKLGISRLEIEPKAGKTVI